MYLVIYSTVLVFTSFVYFALDWCIQYVRGIVGFWWVRHRSSGCFGGKPYFKGMHVSEFTGFMHCALWTVFVRLHVYLWTVPLVKETSSELCVCWACTTAITLQNTKFTCISLV